MFHLRRPRLRIPGVAGVWHWIFALLRQAEIAFGLCLFLRCRKLCHLYLLPVSSRTRRSRQDHACNPSEMNRTYHDQTFQTRGTLLMQAAVYTTPVDRDFLLAHGADVNAANKADHTALMRAMPALLDRKSTRLNSSHRT